MILSQNSKELPRFTVLFTLVFVSQKLLQVAVNCRFYTSDPPTMFTNGVCMNVNDASLGVSACKWHLGRNFL